MHDAIGGRRAPPDGVLQVTPDACQDDLKHGQAAAQPLLGQQVALPGDGDLLGIEKCISLLSLPQTLSATSHEGVSHLGAGCTWDSFTHSRALALYTLVHQWGCLVVRLMYGK